MNIQKQMKSWLTALFSKRQFDTDMDAEMRSHIEMRTHENIETGMNPEEARFAALRQFGWTESIKETCRDQRSPLATRHLSPLLQDIRYGARQLRKNPGFTVVAVLTLALGIGMNAGVFSVINGLLIRPRVSKDPDTFVHLSPQYSFAGRDEAVGMPGAISLADFRAYRAATNSLVDLAGWAIQRMRIEMSAQQELAMLVTPNFFSVYGLERAKLGRLFLAEECAMPGAAPVVVLSEEIWRNRFGADPQILGTTINLSGHPFTVVGVTPARFSGRLRGRGIWVPYTAQPLFSDWHKNLFNETRTPWLQADGRLNLGRSRSVAQSELSVLANVQDQLLPGRQTTMTLTNGSLVEEPSQRAAVVWVPPLVMGAVSLVLLITCVNVTMLLFARAAARQREIAIRLALGVGRRRLFRMLLTESLLLASVAGAISAYLAYQVPSVFEKIFVEAPNYPLDPDWRVFAYLTVVTFVAGGVAGLWPARESLKLSHVTALSGQMNFFGTGTKRWRAGEFLVAAQVAMSVVVLGGAGIFARTQATMLNIAVGFETKQVLLALLEMNPSRFQATTVASFYQIAMEHVRALPGVEAVCYAGSPPGWGAGMDVVGEKIKLPSQLKGTEQRVEVNSVSPGFFETMRIPMIAGRTFHESETALGGAGGVVVSESFTRTFWPGTEALGKFIEDPNGNHLQVVGVVRDTKSLLGATEGPRFYRSWDPKVAGYSLLVRFQGAVRPVADGVRNSIKAIDPEVNIMPRTLRSQLDEIAARFWVIVRLLLTLALLAVLLALIGIYGVMAFLVNGQTKTLGIRIALGASKGAIARLVLSSALRPILAGLGAGTVIAMAGAETTIRAVGEMPVPLVGWDPAVHVAVAAILLAAAMLAVFKPTLGATRVDPMVALRNE